MSEVSKNELYIALPEGKLHVYVTETTPDTKDGLIHLDDDYMKNVHVDLIDKDGKAYQLSKTQYQFTRTDHEDENGNKIWLEQFWVTGKDIEPPIDMADLKGLTPEEELEESKRVSSKEYIEMVKGYFTRKE